VDELLDPVDREAQRLLYEDPRKPRLLLSDVKEEYLRHHPKGDKPSFIKVVNLGVDAVLKCVGNLPLEQYSRNHAITVRDHLLSRGNRTTTVRRRLDTINAAFNHGIRERGLGIHNHFSRLTIPREGMDASKRASFTIPELQTIARATRAKDDDIRHLVARIPGPQAKLHAGTVRDRQRHARPGQDHWSDRGSHRPNTADCVSNPR
jgi:hypothetical protein